MKREKVVLYFRATKSQGELREVFFRPTTTTGGGHKLRQCEVQGRATCPASLAQPHTGHQPLPLLLALGEAPVSQQMRGWAGKQLALSTLPGCLGIWAGPGNWQARGPACPQLASGHTHTHPSVLPPPTLGGPNAIKPALLSSPIPGPLQTLRLRYFVPDPPPIEQGPWDFSITFLFVSPHPTPFLYYSTFLLIWSLTN